MKRALGKLRAYEALHAVNRGFEQVLDDLERLDKLGLFEREDFNLFQGIVEETRAFVNCVLVELMQMREEKDWAQFGRVRYRWEKKMKDPNDVLIEAERLKKQLRKKAGSKGRL
jgi:hypothetical protein